MVSKTTHEIQLALTFILVGILLVVVIDVAFGQEVITEQPQQQEAPSAIPPETAYTGVGIAGAGTVIALAKQLLDQRTNKKRDRETDKDTGRWIILQAKFYQAKKLYPNMSDVELLDLPVSNNPFATQTFGQAFTSEADLWAEGNATYWGIPKPNMSVPTQTTVAAVKASTAAPPTQPPPPGNINNNNNNNNNVTENNKT